MEETSRVLVSAEQIPTNSNHHQHQHLRGTMNVTIELRHKLRIECDDHRHSRAAETNVATGEHSLPRRAFASAAAAVSTVESILSGLRFRFPSHATRWSHGGDDGDGDDASSVPVDGLRGVAARVSELGSRMFSSSATSRDADAPPLGMRVRIRKLTVIAISHDELVNYEPLLLFHQHLDGGVYRSLADYYLAAVNAEIDEYLGGRAELPAAAAAAALETVRYEGEGDESKKLTCPICIDDVAIGSHVTRLPCTHRFHGDCVGKWLKKSGTCPLCRSMLYI